MRKKGVLPTTTAEEREGALRALGLDPDDFKEKPSTEKKSGGGKKGSRGNGRKVRRAESREERTYVPSLVATGEPLGFDVPTAQGADF